MNNKKHLMLAVTAAVLLINSSAYSGSFIPPQNKQNTTIIRNKKIPIKFRFQLLNFRIT